MSEPRADSHARWTYRASLGRQCIDRSSGHPSGIWTQKSAEKTQPTGMQLHRHRTKAWVSIWWRSKTGKIAIQKPEDQVIEEEESQTESSKLRDRGRWAPSYKEQTTHLNWRTFFDCSYSGGIFTVSRRRPKAEPWFSHRALKPLRISLCSIECQWRCESTTRTVRYRH